MRVAVPFPLSVNWFGLLEAPSSSYRIRGLFFVGISGDSFRKSNVYIENRLLRAPPNMELAHRIIYRFFFLEDARTLKLHVIEKENRKSRWCPCSGATEGMGAKPEGKKTPLTPSRAALDAIAVILLCIFLLPLLASYASVTATLAVTHNAYHLILRWWHPSAGPHDRDQAIEAFWVSAWMFYNLVVIPGGLAVFILITFLPLVFLGSLGPLATLLHRVWLTTAASYCVWAYLIDDSVNRGGVASPTLRRLGLWSRIASYFDMKILVEGEGEEGPRGGHGSRIFCYHPHGIIFWGVIAGFASWHWKEVRLQSRTLQSCDVRLGTISFNNLVPVFREVNKNIGSFTVSWNSCLRALERGLNILIIPGGARESMDAFPGTMNVRIRSRRGFVRLALARGASLVPVLSFGESDMYNLLKMKPGSLAFRVQRVYQSLFGFTVPLFWGKTLWGMPTIMPLRRPIRVVIGKPIQVVST